jgi:hypothetical protein
MRRIVCLGVILAMAVGCNGKKADEGDCSTNADCKPGEVCSAHLCVQVCSSDSDCAADSICRDAVCVVGRRSTAPEIVGVDGNGSTPDHFADGLVVTGRNLAGATVTLAGPISATLDIDAVSDTRLEVKLPLDLEEGHYVLTAANALGSDQADLRILQGDKGDPATAADVLAMLITVDGSGSNVDADLLDGRDSSSFALAADAVDRATLQSTSFVNLAVNGSFERWPSGRDTWPMGWAEQGTQGNGSISGVAGGWVDSTALRLEDVDFSGETVGVLTVYDSGLVPASLYGATVVLTVWARREAGLATGSISVADAGAAGAETSITTEPLPVSSSWTMVRFTHTLSGAPEYLKIITSAATSDTASYDLDGLMLTAGDLAPDYFVAHEFDKTGQSLAAYTVLVNLPEHIQNQGTTPVSSTRAVSYDKRFDRSLLKVTYNDNIRVYNYTNTSGPADCRFHLYFDGEPCTVPGSLHTSIYTPNSAATNPHRQRSLIGVCRETASGPLLAGPHEVRVYVAEVTSGDIGCHMGRSSTSTLLVEELP